jgi:two-component system, sensor histidine kinase PdtaS
MDQFRAEQVRSWIRRLSTYGITTRYIFATASVGIVTAVQLIATPLPGGYVFILYYPAVTLSALLLDRGAGFYTAILSAFLTVLLFIEPRFSLIIPTQADAVALFIFLACSVVITLVAESFRLLLERLDTMEREKDLLFRELAHRTRNNLQIVMSMLAMERAQAASGELRARLDLIEGRIGVLAQMHDRLRWQNSNGAIKIRDFVQDLCADVRQSLAGHRPVVVRPQIENLSLEADFVIALGIIVNELLTNAFKYAFPDDRAGAIDVRLSQEASQHLVLVCEDNGIGCPETARSGTGTGLILALVQQHDGMMSREAAAPGCRVVIRFPFGQSYSHAESGI